MTSVRDPFKHFNLASCVGVRPNPFTSELVVDEEWMRATSAAILKWPGARPAEEWIASSAFITAADNVWVSREQLRPLDDVCTRFLSIKCFPSSQTRVNLILNLHRTYDALARLSGRANALALKGGIAHRLRLLEFCHDMPVDVRAPWIDYLSKLKAVGMSDLDFEAEIDQSTAGRKYQNIMLIFATLLWIKKRINDEYASDGSQGALFDFSWTDQNCNSREELRGALQKAVDGLEARHPLHGAAVDSVVIGNRVANPPKG